MSIWDQVMRNVVAAQPKNGSAEDAPAATTISKKGKIPTGGEHVIGRDDELHLFESFLDKARQSQGSMLVFTGDGGSGKTYLLKKMRDLALKEKIAAFYGRATSSAANDPYQPIFSTLGLGFDSQGRIVQVSIVNKTADNYAIDTMKAAYDLSNLVLGLTPVVGTVIGVGMLATKIGKYIYQNRQRSQTEGGVGTNPTFEALRRRLGDMMGVGKDNPRPLVLALDNLHLAQETTFRLLDYLLAPDWPLLIVASWNNEGGKLPLLLTDSVARVGGAISQLRTLTVDEAQELAISVADEANLNAAIKKAISDNAATLARLSGGQIGVVMAGVEYLAQGRDPELLGQLLVGGGEERIAAGGTGGAALLHALAGQQIEQLDNSAQDLLSCAALIGDSFAPRILTRPDMLNYLGLSERAALRILLSQAEARRILVETPDEPNQLNFSSAVTRQLLLRRVPRTLAQRDHRIIAASWQEALGLTPPPGFSSDEPQTSPQALAEREQALLGQEQAATQAPPEALAIAEHFETSGDTLLAFYYARLAGQARMQLRAYPEALVAFDKALGYLDTLPTLPNTAVMAQRVSERIELLQAAAFAEEVNSNLDKAAERLDEALKAAADNNLKQAQADTLSQLGWVRFKKEELDEAQKHLLKAQQLYAEVGDAEGQVHVDYYLGSLYSQAREHDKAVDAFQRSLDTAQTAGLPDTDLDLILLELGQVYIRMNRYEDAEKLIAHGLEVARRQNDVFSQALGLRYQGRLWLEMRKPETLDTLREAQKIARDTLRDSYLESTIINTLALALERFNKMDEARSAYQEALPILERTGNSYGLGAALGGLGRLALNRGQYDEAAEYLYRDLALVMKASPPSPVIVSQLLTSLAHAVRGQGQPEKAAEWLAQSLEVAKHVGDQKARTQTFGYAHLEEGWQALEAEKTSEAEKFGATAASELQQVDSNQPEVNLLRAAVACKVNKPGEAIALLSKNLDALKQMPEGASDLHIAAMTHLQIAELCTQGPTDATDIDARPWATKALQFAESLGNEPMQERAHKILDELPAEEQPEQSIAG